MKIISIKIDIPIFDGIREFNFSGSNIIKINGENASGKSVILSLLDTDAITKEYMFNIENFGFKVSKEIIVEHNDQVFTLYSEVNKTKTKCSFKVGNEEKCKNGSVTLYRTLVEDYDLKMMTVVNQKSSAFFDLKPADRKKYVQERFVDNYELIEEARSKIKDKILLSKTSEINFREQLVDDVEGFEKELVTKKDLVDKITIHVNNEKVLKDELALIMNNRIFMNKPSIDNEFVPNNYDGSYDNIDFNEQIISVSSEINTLKTKETSIKKFKDYLKKISDYEAIKVKRQNLGFNVKLPDQLINMVTVRKYQKHLENVNTLLKMVIPPVTIEQEQNNLKEAQAENLKLFEERTQLQTTINLKRNIIAKSSVPSDNNCLQVDETCIKQLNEEINSAEADINSVNNFIVTGEEIKVIENKILYHQELIALKNVVNQGNVEFNFEDIDTNFLVEDYFTINREVDVREKELTTLEAVTEKFDDHNVDYSGKEQTLRKLKEAQTLVKEMRQFYLNETQYNDKLKIVQDKIDNLGQNDYNDTHLKLFKEEVYSLQVKIDGHKTADINLPNIHKTVTTLELGQKILQPNNLPSILSLRKLKLVEEKINNLIHGSLTNNLTVEFRYSKTKLDIFVRTKLTENVYEKLSGYETSVIKLAFELVVTDFNTDVLRVDELDGPFDTNNRIKFSSFVSKLLDGDKCDQIFLISHNQEFNEGLLKDFQVISTDS